MQHDMKVLQDIDAPAIQSALEPHHVPPAEPVLFEVTKGLAHKSLDRRPHRCRNVNDYRVHGPNEFGPDNEVGIFLSIPSGESLQQKLVFGGKTERGGF